MALEPLRVGTVTRRAAWLIAGMLPVALLTAPGAPWEWGFVLTYVVMAFALHLLVRTKSPGVERLLHILVLAGSAPVVVRFYFGTDLPAVGLVHVAAVLAISIGVGYWLSERVRPQVRKPSRWSGAPRAGQDVGHEL